MECGAHPSSQARDMMNRLQSQSPHTIIERKWKKSWIPCFHYGERKYKFSQMKSGTEYNITFFFFHPPTQIKPVMAIGEFAIPFLRFSPRIGIDRNDMRPFILNGEVVPFRWIQLLIGNRYFLLPIASQQRRINNWPISIEMFQNDHYHVYHYVRHVCPSSSSHMFYSPATNYNRLAVCVWYIV